jgi:cell division protein FtsX
VRLCFCLALSLAIFLSACGGSHRATSVPRTGLGLKACGVRVYFSGRATHAQEQAVGAKLRRESSVKQVTFVSKARALAELKKSNPGLYKAIKLKRNPLPDAFTVLPVTPSDTRQVSASVEHAPGVAAVKLTPCRFVR